MAPPEPPCWSSAKGRGGEHGHVDALSHHPEDRLWVKIVSENRGRRSLRITAPVPCSELWRVLRVELVAGCHASFIPFHVPLTFSSCTFPFVPYFFLR